MAAELIIRPARIVEQSELESLQLRASLMWEAYREALLTHPRGVQRRLLIIPFNRTIPETERIEHIGARVAREEADLLLDWAVEGAARLVKQRCFGEPKSSQDALRDWLLGADPVLAWLEVPGRVRIGEFRPRVLTATAHAAFKVWAVGEGFSEGTLPAVNTFVQRLLSAGRGIERVRDRGGRFLIGIDLDPVE